MSTLPSNLLFSLLFLISIIGIGIYVQVKLSESENKFLGLILPVLSFLLSLFLIFGITIFSAFTSSSVDGLVQSIEQIVIGISYPNIFFLFLITNIPTAIFSGIYLSGRNKINLKKSIKKIKIDGL